MTSANEVHLPEELIFGYVLGELSTEQSEKVRACAATNDEVRAQIRAVTKLMCFDECDVEEEFSTAEEKNCDLALDVALYGQALTEELSEDLTWVSPTGHRIGASDVIWYVLRDGKWSTELVEKACEEHRGLAALLGTAKENTELIKGHYGDGQKEA